MRKDATGQFSARRTKRGTVWGVRFKTLDGRRVHETVGRSWEGVTEREAWARADQLLARVKLGQYRTRAELAEERAARAVARVEAPLFADFAEEWFERKRALGGNGGEGLGDSSYADLRNLLDRHLKPWFAGFRLDEIDVEEVERYAAAKRAAPVGRGGLGATYTNKSLAVLRAIFRTAVRYGRIPLNPAEGVTVKAEPFRGSHLDKAEKVEALLAAAGSRDKEGRSRQGHGRPLLATLVFAGLRIDEALSLRWSEVDLARGTLRILASKTAAGRRTVDLVPPLRQELADLKARRNPDRADLVFGTGRGGKDSASNVRRRILATAADEASAALMKAGADPLPERLTPHSLRRTFTAGLLAYEDVLYVARQLGHVDPAFTYRVYGREINRRDGERERFKALFRGEPMPDLPAASDRPVTA